MDIALWIVQVLLALAFGMVGYMKLATPKAKAAEMMPYVNDFTQNQLYLIGILEIAGAVGVILPALTKILPILTPIAALGLGLTMIGAAYTHLRRKEYPMIIPNIVLLALAIFVAYGRFALVPLA